MAQRGSRSKKKRKKPEKFWSDHCSQLSQKLWLPAAIPRAAPQTTASDDVVAPSWFTATKEAPIAPLPDPNFCDNLAARIESQVLDVIRLEKFIHNVTTPPHVLAEQANRTKEPAGQCRKIRVYPTTEQKEIIRKWIGTVRWTYNQCVAAVKERRCQADKQALRAMFHNNTVFVDTENAWVLETPNNMRDEGISDFIKARDSNFAKQRLNPDHVFDIKFKSKKAPQDSVVIHSKFYKAKYGHYAFLKHMKTGGSDVLPERLHSDSRLVRTRLGEYYFCIPVPLDVVGENQAPIINPGIDSGVLSLDPGVRTFMTGYDPSGKLYEFGKADIGAIGRMCKHLDDLQSRWSQKTVKHRQRYNMQRAGRRIRKRIRNMVDDLHHKLAKWITSSYHIVLLPKFETSQMTNRLNRKIGSKTVRSMLTLSHYRFRQHMLHMSRKHPWCKVYIVDEAYTSKTCGSCGHIHEKLGGNKKFHCPSCGIWMDRDLNGARNILIRFLAERESRLRLLAGEALGPFPVV